MITHLRGLLAHKAPTRAVVEVGGVGYELSVSLATYDGLPAAGSPVEILAHTHVREDQLALFGFLQETEREMFRLLIGISGIGPNLALTILSGLSVDDLARAIQEERAGDLTRVRGIGPRTAQRVVVDLKDRIRRPLRTGPGAPREAGSDAVVDEAMRALEALGFAGPAARKALEAVRKRLGEGEASVQALIKGALRER